jgi:hypothetical protein
MAPTPQSSGLTSEDWARFEAMIVRVAAETAARHACRFATISDEDAPEMGHAIGVIADVGKGDLRAGLEVARENLKWTARVRERLDQAGVAAAVGFVGIAITGITTAIWLGIKSSLK